VKSKRVFVAFLLLLSFTALSFKCDSGGGGGSVPDPYRKAAKAADDIAASLNTMTKIKRDLGTSGKLSRDREIALTNLLQKANTADRAFLNEIKKLKADPNPATKASLCSLFNTVSAALTDLNNSGILPVEDADAKSKLATVFSTITTLTAIISSAGMC
jgi:hypothetical protein